SISLTLPSSPSVHEQSLSSVQKIRTQNLINQLSQEFQGQHKRLWAQIRSALESPFQHEYTNHQRQTTNERISPVVLLIVNRCIHPMVNNQSKQHHSTFNHNENESFHCFITRLGQLVNHLYLSNSKNSCSIIKAYQLDSLNKQKKSGSLISPNGLVSDEISTPIQKVRLAFANLRHLWRRRDICLSIKGLVYCAAVRSVLLYSCEKWPLGVENTRVLLLFDHRRLKNIARICWDHQLSNSEVRRRFDQMKLDFDNQLDNLYKSGERCFHFISIDLLPVEIVLLFHGYTDTENSIYSNSILIISLSKRFDVLYAALALSIRAFTSASNPPCSSIMLLRYVKVFTSSKASPSSVIRLLHGVLYRRILLFPLCMLRPTDAEAAAATLVVFSFTCCCV
ncbi:unnamed protein product, partial [Schistosoma mattheei]